MSFVGLDVGISYTKATLLKDGQVLAHVALPGGLESAEHIARRAVEEAIKVAGVCAQPQYVVATGQGKSFISFADETVSDAVCLARGIKETLPSVHTLLDLGMQKTLLIRCANGIPTKMLTSDKCASGAGSSLEVISNVLEIPIEQMGEISLRSTQPVEIDSTCAVFAETEVISLLYSKKQVEDIIHGVYRSLATRLYSMLLRVGVEPELGLVGGLASDKGMVRSLKDQVGCEIVVPNRPLFVGSLGAAIIAEKKWQKGKS